MDLSRFLGAQPRPVGEQQFTRAVPFPWIGQIRGVHPADLTVDARLADDQRDLQVRELQEFTDRDRHPRPPAVAEKPAAVRWPAATLRSLLGPQGSYRSMSAGRANVLGPC